MPRSGDSSILSNAVALAKKAYQAYVDKHRALIESLLADDFHFTSPLDNRLDRATYFARCWPNSERITGFTFIHCCRTAIACSLPTRAGGERAKRFATRKY
jgi:hypothetical protein